MRDVQPGDVVFHLCGKSGKAAFTGFSIAASSCVRLDQSPYGPERLYRVDLREHQPFPEALPLSTVFSAHDKDLRNYFWKNRGAGAAKERLFYVVQDGRLQCLNGAYLSYLSDRLLDLLFSIQVTTTSGTSRAVAAATSTGTVLAEAAQRVGHQGFSRNVKANYANRCCFPGCTVDDSRFLIGAHIARWSDVPALRGETSNGLCLCLVHDKAFEVGAFTFNASQEVVLGGAELCGPWLSGTLASAAGQRIRAVAIPPSFEALSHHWHAHGFECSA
jgi:hypothetical protein